MTSRAPRICIVGAGPAGLACARVLQRHGLDAAVYDADASVDARDPGGTLDLHADTGQIALEDAGLSAAFAAAARPEGQAKTRTDHRGTVLARFTPAPGDEAAPEIDRGRLRRLLHDSLRPGTVRWGHRLDRAVPLGGGVHRLEFAHGATAEADLLVGADGAWSAVRPLLTAAAPQHLGVAYLDARYDEVDTRHPEIAELLGEGHLFANDGDGRALILQRNADGVVRGYLALRTGPDGAAGPADRLAAEFAHWSPALRALIARTGGDAVPRTFRALPAPLTWDHVPGATLLGDAAHLMAPFGGHGANLALLDGAELARAVRESADPDTAVRRFETELFARSGPLAASANAALTRFFATTPPDAPHLPPDHAQEHRGYVARAAERRARRAAGGAA